MLFCNEGFDFVVGECRKNFDVFGGVLVTYVQPELVEFIGRGIAGIEPNVTRLGFPELPAVGFGDEWAGESIDLSAVGTAYQFCPCGDIAPLVRTSQLQFAIFGFVKMQEIVAL